MKVLMVITSHDQLGNTGRKTGFWLEELAAPYYVFKDSGAEVTLASPKGGRPPLDPKSNEPENRTELTLRFENDEEAGKLSSTRPFASTASSRKTSTRCFIPAVTGRCGISPTTRTRSS